MGLAYESNPISRLPEPVLTVRTAPACLGPNNLSGSRIVVAGRGGLVSPRELSTREKMRAFIASVIFLNDAILQGEVQFYSTHYIHHYVVLGLNCPVRRSSLAEPLLQPILQRVTSSITEGGPRVCGHANRTILRRMGETGIRTARSENAMNLWQHMLSYEEARNTYFIFFFAGSTAPC